MLAVADSTAAEHSQNFRKNRRKTPVFSTLLWTLVALAVILIIALIALLLMGDSLANKLRLIEVISAAVFTQRLTTVIRPSVCSVPLITRLMSSWVRPVSGVRFC